MNLFETSSGDYVNLDHVTNYENSKNMILMRFAHPEKQAVAVQGEDAKRLAHILAKLADKFDRKAAKK